MKNLKYKFVFLLLLLLPSFAKSQQIDNSSFDSICVCAIDRIWQWVTSDAYYFQNDTAQAFSPYTLYNNGNTELHMAMNTVQFNFDDPDSLGLAHSLKILTRPNLVYESGSVFRGFIINGEHFYSDANGLIDLNRCGTAFTFRPDSISGRYKFQDSLSTVAETAQVKLLLKKYNTLNHTIDTIGFAESSTELSPTLSWKRFTLPIHYLSSSSPDSVVLAIYSSSANGGPTTLWIDDIQLIYGASGISASEGNKREMLFPNPAHDRIYVDPALNKQSPYRIYDLRGSLMQSGLVEGSIDIRLLPPSVYVLQIEANESTVHYYKIVKQ